MKFNIMIISLIGILAAAPVIAQEAEIESADAAATMPAEEMSAVDMQQLREKLRENKKLLVSQNMGLTQKEANGFWPVYDAYQKDLEIINQRMTKIIEAYVTNYESQSMTDEIAKELVDDFVDLAQDEAELTERHVPKFRKVLSPQKVLRYIQLENKIRALVKFDIATAVPLHH
jgi:hypothetical protein